MPELLSTDSFDWALKHIKKYGDTDIFPPCFEFDAINSNWLMARNGLAMIDLQEHSADASRSVMVPKPGVGFRAAVQLDPMDSLLYSAAIYECGNAIENARVPIAERVACSYRIELSPDGNLFRKTDGWEDFRDHSEDLVRSGLYGFVVSVDIADFYNQAYHHRIENNLETATVPVTRAKAIETFLASITALQSRGLPVGPFASIALAEVCLVDVDAFLISRGHVFVRYVDDFRIFCVSRKAAIKVLHDLTQYLYTAHRLSLQLSKTKIQSVEVFASTQLEDPAQQEEQNAKSKITEILEMMRDITGYRVLPEDLKESTKHDVTIEVISEVFDQCCAGDSVELGLSRYVLRRATSLRSRALYTALFDNLEKFVPVLRDVMVYLDATMPPNGAEEWGERLRDFANAGDYGTLPYVRMWILHLLQRKPQMLPFPDALSFAESSSDELRIRASALLARSHRNLAWVRAQKERWKQSGPWEKRAIIWSSSVLPTDERRNWLRTVKASASPLETYVALAAANGI